MVVDVTGYADRNRVSRNGWETARRQPSRSEIEAPDCPGPTPRTRAHACRIAGVTEAHTHALLGIFHRSLMAAMIADSTASFRYQGKPIADSALVSP
jgi:hypothetical protein